MSQYGELRDYFEGVALKTLAPVDLPKASKSHQHEFNGIAVLKQLLGSSDRHHIPAKFMYLDDWDPTISENVRVSWYDARRNDPRRTEFRLYYQDNSIINKLEPGDLMVTAQAKAGELLFVFAAKDSDASSQLQWLFGLKDPGNRFELSPAMDRQLGFVSASILEQIGIEPETSTPDAEELARILLNRFPEGFPKTREFSAFAEEMAGVTRNDWIRDADGTMLRCYEQEELMFRIYEQILLEDELEPFLVKPVNVDAFLKIAMSTFQRRRSRAGSASGIHLASLFNARNIHYTPQPYTEGRSKPDFIFPSIQAYRDPAFPAPRLTMLGAKTTVKERWRQVLDEADRVPHKFLATLEGAISPKTTDAMTAHNLTLVIPEPIQETYQPGQRIEMFTLEAFCEHVEHNQRERV